MTDPGRAVFLSYASQDAPAAGRISQSLRNAGVEVWFDQNELRGGDAWDTSIRRQIKSCSLFIPLISANTRTREEGYFRREWNLAVARTLDMADDRAFLLPVVIDDTAEPDARVPEKFREVQWTRLPQGANADPFAEHVRRLVSGALERDPRGASPILTRAASDDAAVNVIPTSGRSRMILPAAGIAVAVISGCLFLNRQTLFKHSSDRDATSTPASRVTAPADFSPPAHSIAVLPFANMSGDKDQDYFSDGLTEEILNSLTEVDGLQVAARTSAFSFKGTNTDIGAIARKLNVGTVLEGSVRRSAHTIRITVQLINAVTGYHLWSKSYDRDLGDVLKLQTEIATSVANALKVTLLGDVATRIELGGTSIPAAFDAYLRGAKAVSSFRDTKDVPAAIASYSDAIRLDPRYALAFAARSIAYTNVAGEADVDAEVRENYDKARSDARQALALAPDLAQAHLALALLSDHNLDFVQAASEYERALALAPGNAEVLRHSGEFSANMGRFDAGITATRRAVVLDPLDFQSHVRLGRTLYAARRYEESAAAFAEAISLKPDLKSVYAARGLSLYGIADLPQAIELCEKNPDYWPSLQCLAVVYEKLGRHSDANAAFSKLKALGDNGAYQVATVYSQWGEHDKAFESLGTAMRLHDPGLITMRIDPLLDPLRSDKRFLAIEQKLRFPN